jgi:hypothetical protein
MTHALALFENQEQVSVAVLGAGGIGKTSIALSLIHGEKLVKKFGQRRYFIACDALEKLDALIERFGMTLGLNEQDPLLDLTRIAKEICEPILITLDNLETLWESIDNRTGIERFLSDLALIPLVSVIVTVRGAERPAGVAWTRPFLPPIAPLNLQAAIDVFTSISDIRSDDPHMVQLILAVDLIPLAITLIANQAQYLPCQELFETWGEQKTKMVSREAPYNDGRLSSLEVSIELSLKSPRFTQEPDALRLLQLLSILPDGAPDWFLASMTANNLSLKPATATLLRVSLATRDGYGHLKALSPVREYVSSHLPISDADMRTGFEHLERDYDLWISRWGTEESWNVRKNWQRQSGNIMPFLRHCILRPRNIPAAASTKAALHLLDILVGYTAIEPLLSVLRNAADIARDIPDLKAVHAALYIQIGGEELVTSASVEDSEKLYSLVQVLRESGDAEMLAEALSIVAYIAAFPLNSVPKLVSCAQELIRLQPEISPMRLISSYTAVATYLRKVGRIDISLDMLRISEAVADAHNIMSVSRRGINEGFAHLDAIRGSYYQGYRRLYSSLDATELSQPMGRMLLLLAMNSACQGRLEEAEKAGTLAFQTFSQIGNISDWGGESLCCLFFIYLAQGRLQDASNASDHSQRIGSVSENGFQKFLAHITKLAMYPSSKLEIDLSVSQREGGQGKVFRRGELLYRTNRMWPAFRNFVVCLITECSVGYRLGISMLFLRIGDYFRVFEQDMGVAESCYKVSLRIIQFIGTLIHQADALSRVALCQQYRGDSDAAIASLSQAHACISHVGMKHQLEILEQKKISLLKTDDQDLFTLDALPLPTLIGMWDIST